MALVFAPEHHSAHCTLSTKMFDQPSMFAMGLSFVGFILGFPIDRVDQLTGDVVSINPVLFGSASIDVSVELIHINSGEFLSSEGDKEGFIAEGSVGFLDAFGNGFSQQSFGFGVHIDIKVGPAVECGSVSYGILVSFDVSSSNLDWQVGNGLFMD